MARYSTFTKPVIEPIADGQYPAILYQIIDLGSQKFGKDGREWFSAQRLFGFEIPGLTYENKDGESISKVISVTSFDSLNPSRNGQIGQREIIDAIAQSAGWDEQTIEAYDLDQLLGKQVILTIAGVESKGKVYQNITAIESMPGDMPLTPMREKVSVTIDDFKNDFIVTELPTWIQNKIYASNEYHQLNDVKNDVPTEQGRTFTLPEEDEINIEDVPFA